MQTNECEARPIKSLVVQAKQKNEQTKIKTEGKSDTGGCSKNKHIQIFETSFFK